MPRFVIPVTIELQFEANSALEALRKFNSWRKTVRSAMQSLLEENGLFRFSIPPAREITEVDSQWQENHKLRSKFRQEWEYEFHQASLVPGSQITFTHRIAIGPLSGNEGTQRQQQ